MLHLYFPMSMPSWSLVISSNRRNEARLIILMARAKRNYWFEFSAARQTMSPHLSKAENERLFGDAASFTVTIIGRV